MNYFIKYSNNSKENPALVVCNDHVSHISKTILNIANENGVTLLTVLSHTSHDIQPQDVPIYALLNAYNKGVDNRLLAHLGTPITIYQHNCRVQKSGIFPLCQAPHQGE